MTEQMINHVIKMSAVSLGGAHKADVALLYLLEIEERVLTRQLLFQPVVVWRRRYAVILSAYQCDSFEVFYLVERILRRLLSTSVILFVKFGRAVIVHGELATVKYLQEVHEGFGGGARATVIRIVDSGPLANKHRLAVRTIHVIVLGVFVDRKQIENEEVAVSPRRHLGILCKLHFFFKFFWRELLLFQFLREIVVYIVHVDDWRDCNEAFHVLVVEFWVRDERDEHLRGALAVADVGDVLLPGDFDHFFPQGRLIIESHFVKAEVEKLLSLAVLIWVYILFAVSWLQYVKEFVLFREPITPRIIEPDVEAGLDQAEADRIRTVDHKCYH